MSNTSRYHSFHKSWKYDTAAKQFDDKSLDLEEQLSALNIEIKTEQWKPVPTRNHALRTNVGIDLVATVDGDIEKALKCGETSFCLLQYMIKPSTFNVPVGTPNTTFRRVESATVLLVYKASISQTKGEVSSLVQEETITRTDHRSSPMG